MFWFYKEEYGGFGVVLDGEFFYISFWVKFQMVRFGVMCRVPVFGGSIGRVFLKLYYCSRFQVERTSTWNPHTPRMYGKARTETYPRIGSGRQHGGHKITT